MIKVTAVNYVFIFQLRIRSFQVGYHISLVYLSSPAARSINGIAMAMDFGNSAT